MSSSARDLGLDGVGHGGFGHGYGLEEDFVGLCRRGCLR